MRLRSLLILTFATLSLFGQEVFAVKEGENRFAYYVQDETDPGLYYKSGVKTAQTALRPTPLIKIAFDQGIEPEALLTPYDLRLIKTFASYSLYEASSPQKSVAIASRIWETTGIRYAVPLFERKKELK